MNKLIIFITLMLNGVLALGQTGINYQAVARDAKGEPYENKTIDVRFSIHKGNLNGEIVWQEVHNAPTNQFGLFTVIIGKGTRQSGTAQSFDAISWGADTHFLQVEVNFGTNYIDFGTTQFLAVPYALYALKSGSSSTTSQQLTLNTTHKTLDLSNNGGSVKVSDLSSYLSVDKDSTNELQTLVLEGNTLKIKHGNTVDGSVTISTTDNDRQMLSLSGHVLKIENANEVTLPSDADADPTNELQTLWYDKGTIGITNGNSFPLPQPALFLEKNQLTLKVGTVPNGSYSIDTDSTNEIQHLTYTGKYITLDGGRSGAGSSIYDADTSKTNELITNATFDGDKLHITEAGTDHSVDISELKNTPWAGFSTTVSNLSFATGDDKEIIFSDEFYDNTNSFNSTNFKAPLTGVYTFNINLAFTNGNYQISIVKAGSNIKTYSDISGVFSISIMLDIMANETVLIKVKHTSGYAGILYAGSFSGYRVH